MREWEKSGVAERATVAVVAGGGGGDGIHVTQAKVVAVRVSSSSSLAVERDGPRTLPYSRDKLLNIIFNFISYFCQLILKSHGVKRKSFLVAVFKVFAIILLVSAARWRSTIRLSKIVVGRRQR